MPALGELKERTLSLAIGPRQRAGTRVYTARGEYREGGSGELYALPGSERIRAGFRMADDDRKGIPKSLPTLEIMMPDSKNIKFHYNTER